MERRIYLLILGLTLALGVYLRLDDLGGPSLWLDEIIHLSMAEKLAVEPWYRALTGIVEVEGYTENGPVYYWFQILGQRLAAGGTGARLFPALFGIVTLPLMALVGMRVGGRLVSLVATFLLAVSPLHVYFSREGRPYSLIILLAVVLLYLLLVSGSRRATLLTYGTCLFAAYVGLHSVTILMAFLGLAAISVLWGLKNGESLSSTPYRHAVVAAVLALALTYGLYLTRSELNKVDFVALESPVFLSPLSTRAMERFLASMTTSAHRSVLMVERSWVLIGLSVLGLVAGLRRRPERTALVAGMFVLTAALSILALVSTGRWYAMRYTSSALPAFLLLVGMGLTSLAGLPGLILGSRLKGTGRQILHWTAAGVLILIFVAPNLGAAHTDPRRKLDWRGVADFFNEIAVDGETIVVANAWPEISLGYHLRYTGRSYEFVDVDESVAAAQAVVEEAPWGWLLTAGFRKTGEVRAWMHQFPPVFKQGEEEMALFFFPDFVTLLETRFAVGRGTIFEGYFADIDRRFDFGGAEMFLQGRGWSYQEQNKEGITYQWALGEQAELALPVSDRQESRIRFRALPFTFPEAPDQAVELWLNEDRLATVALPRGWSEHEIVVPADSWSSEANILYLRFDHSTVPAQVIPASKDRRQLAAAFDFLELVTDPAP